MRKLSLLCYYLRSESVQSVTHLEEHIVNQSKVENNNCNSQYAPRYYVLCKCIAYI